MLIKLRMLIILVMLRETLSENLRIFKNSKVALKHYVKNIYLCTVFVCKFVFYVGSSISS